MNCLALDTATEACSVALNWQGQQSQCFDICPQQHSQVLLTMVDDILRQQHASLHDLDCLAFGRGPGSFTGVRIATGMLQGLAFGTGKPVVGVSTLAAMAQQAIQLHQVSHVFCAIDARMGEVYFAHYQAINGLAHLINEELILPPEQADLLITHDADAIGVGTGWAAYAALNTQQSLKIADDILYPAAEFMLPLAMAEFKAGRAKNVMDIEPVYLRDTVTWKKLPGRE
ncbi:MAG: tRNA (adenosine(37)-N6)-threonylcarbamoyltransferase complex dimerization subunit type 1 TsaB [Paraglaciecola sp.]|nr:tRNA (adenosine(37)-N6)-threonylcarbamoyltransferase complex dimerization subunit type 1 TsaB [Paraglaciecola sp.]